LDWISTAGTVAVIIGTVAVPVTAIPSPAVIDATPPPPPTAERSIVEPDGTIVTELSALVRERLPLNAFSDNTPEPPPLPTEANSCWSFGVCVIRGGSNGILILRSEILLDII
jgi:hypothetical protein